MASKNINDITEQVEAIKKETELLAQRRDVLKNVDLFVLDNSIRETTVGQLRGHTIEDKWSIYNEVQKVGLKDMIIASFNHMTRVGDTFIQQLIEKGEDMTRFWAFSELVEVYKDRMPQEGLPVGLEKMKEYGLKNVLLEFDLVYAGIDYAKFTIEKLCAYMNRRFVWIRENLGADAKILVNFRDFSDAMARRPARVMKVVNFLATQDQRIFGLAMEETGKYFSEEVGAWTLAVKKEMERCGWNDGHWLVHVHQQWGLYEACQLAAIANGATGIWAGLCEEGAAMGHASSTLTMLNLVRMGNEKITKRYNCAQLRQAGINVTRITTGKDPHPKQVVYGERALDLVFGLDQFKPNKAEFSLAEFLGEELSLRITTLASVGMIVKQLQTVFGENEQFTEEIGTAMKEKMLEDLNNNIKEEYHSNIGLAMLFDRAGGKLTDEMGKLLAGVELHNKQMSIFMDEIRARWDEWDLRDGTIDDFLTFDAFYNGFMAPYFGCYRCDETKRALTAIDMDEDGRVDWFEFKVYLKWAANQYPDISSSEELLDVAFRKGLVPAMQDAALKVMPQEDDGDDYL